MKLVPVTPKQTVALMGRWFYEAMICPQDPSLLEASLQGVENFVIDCEGLAVGWLGLRAAELDAVTLDLAVAKSYRGKWATRDLLRQAAQVLFKDREFVLLHAKKPSAVKLALSVGANPLYSNDMVRGGVFVLSRASFMKGRLH
ncbi:GNAT family N-acetyltransferase [Bradyrhizobium sp.]|uniref:GNAT family N-acetyltransferase n=1 Tax=Bradyrhizobium sp. TaxID=376 RepID=UPI002735A0EB|nr:hypothetical protein [Bradyrhizobium sp.]MDP3078687.1 hypothetical protein [Bradyrhizobium sp.]